MHSGLASVCSVVVNTNFSLVLFGISNFRLKLFRVLLGALVNTRRHLERL
jgi:hypothetical protein